MTYVQLITPNLNITYTGGWCQRANENSVGQSGVYASAYKAWLANVQHKENPPKGVFVPVYLSLPNGPKDAQGVQQGDVALSCPDGTIAAAALSGTHTGLFKYPSLQAYIDDYAKNNGGATYLGWGEYIGKIQVVKEASMNASQTPVDPTTVKLEYNNALLRNANDGEVKSWVDRQVSVETLQRAVQASGEHITVLENFQIGVEIKRILGVNQVNAKDVDAALKAHYGSNSNCTVEERAYLDAMYKITANK